MNEVLKNVKKAIFIFIEILHIFIEFIPILILFGVIKNALILKLTLIMFLLIPLHWPFFNNECILTIMSNNLNGIESNVTFVERRFKFIGRFFQNIFKKKTPKESILMFTSIVNMINLVIIWYIIFYKMNCKPKNN